jgi:polar amino acid transport system substrate-binding protein
MSKLKYLIYFHAFAVTIALIISCACLSVYGDEIVLAADEWCPFDCIPKTAGCKGFMVDIAESLLTQEGHTVVFKIMKWEAAVASCREGKFNGVIGALKGDAPDFIFPYEPEGFIRQAFFTLMDSPWRYTDTASLAGAGTKLGCAAAYSYCPDIDVWIANNINNKYKVLVCKSAKPLEDLIPLLMNHTISTIVEEASVFQYTVNKMNVSSSIRIAGYGCSPQPGYIAFSPKLQTSKQYAEIISKGMISLRKTGKISLFLKPYGLH